MDQQELFCINHPKRETRVRCSNCDRPICVDCMKQSSVGMKCPDCARVPRAAKRLMRPRYYVLAALAGGGVAAGVGALLAFIRMPFGGFLQPLIAGFLVSSAVNAVTHRAGGAAIKVLAAAVTVGGITLGMWIVGAPLPFIVRGGSAFSILVAAGCAAYMAGR